jgi:TonB family protein
MEEIVRSRILPRVKDCYARALASERQGGRFVVKIQVEASGRVSGADVKENRGLSAGFAKCAREAVLAAQFPCLRSPGTVEVPFNFTLDKNDASTP